MASLHIRFLGLAVCGLSACARVGFGPWDTGPDLREQRAVDQGVVPTDRAPMLELRGDRDGSSAPIDARQEAAADCVPGGGPVVRWVFAQSSVSSGMIVEVPDSAPLPPDVPLQASNVSLVTGEAVCGSGKMTPLSVAQKNALIQSLATANAFTVTVRGHAAGASSYGYILTIWSEFHLVQDHQSFGATIATGPTSSYTLAFGYPLTAGGQFFMAAGWDGVTKQLVTYGGVKEATSTQTGAFAPSGWSASALKLILGTSGSTGPSPWTGTLRSVEIYARRLSKNELDCLSTQGP